MWLTAVPCNILLIPNLSTADAPDYGSINYSALLREARGEFHAYMESQGPEGLPLILRPLFMPHSVGVQYSFEALEWNDRRGFSSAGWLAPR